jgi:hypothetical protein
VNVSPDPDEIVQDEDDYAPGEPAPIKVTVCGPTEVRELPAAGHPGYKTEQVGTAVGVKLLAMEPRRKYATLISNDGDLWISSTQAGAQAGAGGAMRIPAVVPYVIGHMHEVWACAVDVETSVGVESVNWSE